MDKGNLMPIQYLQGKMKSYMDSYALESPF